MEYDQTVTDSEWIGKDVFQSEQNANKTERKTTGGEGILCSGSYQSHSLRIRNVTTAKGFAEEEQRQTKKGIGSGHSIVEHWSPLEPFGACQSPRPSATQPPRRERVSEVVSARGRRRPKPNDRHALFLAERSNDFAARGWHSGVAAPVWLRRGAVQGGEGDWKSG
jgi:hypothetical protein